MILDRIAAAGRERVAEEKKKVTPEEMRHRAESLTADKTFPFRQALRREGLSVICEVKKASPSKGVISEDFPYMEIAAEYESCGADAISVLTEPEFFLGSGKYLEEIASGVKIPCLRKDFIVDSYQIYEAKTLGASAVLLICAILDDGRLAEYLEIAHELGLSALTEVHDGKEAERAVKSGAEIIGINNRDLRDFTVDINTTARIAALLPKDKIIVSESGINSADDARMAEKSGADAILVGEAFMRSPDKKKLLDSLKGTG